MKRTYLTYTLYIIVVSVLMASCTGNDYRNVIPTDCTALISVKPQSLSNGSSPFAAIRETFSGSDSQQGVDLTQNIYLFESADGTLGMCAAISDADDFTDMIKGKGIADNFAERNGFTFCTINKTWIAGYNDDAIIVCGPVIASERARMVRRMSAWLAQDEEGSIQQTPIWEHLMEDSADIRLVAQASAMPKQVVAAFTLGAPKGTAPEDVLVEAEITYNKGTLCMRGKSCSYNTNIRQSLEKASTIYRPITIDWEKMTDEGTFAAVFMNVDGNDFMPYLNDNKALSTMLMGTSAYDKIRSNKEELAIFMAPCKDGKGEDGFTAQVKNLPNGTSKGKERLVVVINIESLRSITGNGLTPLLGNTKRIVYTLKD